MGPKAHPDDWLPSVCPGLRDPEERTHTPILPEPNRRCLASLYCCWRQREVPLSFQRFETHQQPIREEALGDCVEESPRAPARMESNASPGNRKEPRPSYLSRATRFLEQVARQGHPSPTSRKPAIQDRTMIFRVPPGHGTVLDTLHQFVHTGKPKNVWLVICKAGYHPKLQCR